MDPRPAPPAAGEAALARATIEAIDRFERTRAPLLAMGAPLGPCAPDARAARDFDAGDPAHAIDAERARMEIDGFLKAWRGLTLTLARWLRDREGEDEGELAGGEEDPGPCPWGAVRDDRIYLIRRVRRVRDGSRLGDPYEVVIEEATEPGGPGTVLSLSWLEPDEARATLAKLARRPESLGFLVDLDAAAVT